MKTQTSFKERVFDVPVEKITKGKTATYKEVALEAVNPLGARAVGMIMSRNKDISVPCHRVIRSDGKIGGYNGIRGSVKGSKTKEILLRKEGSL